VGGRFILIPAFFCFNPYSAGDSSGSWIARKLQAGNGGFNPYSAGDSSGRQTKGITG